MTVADVGHLAKQTITRVVALGVGTGALIIQYEMIRSRMADADPVLQLVPLCLGIALALSAVAVEICWKRGHYFKAFLCVLLFILLTAGNLSGTLGRVSEYRADKGADISKIARNVAQAKHAVARAEADEDDAKKEIKAQCAASTPGPKCTWWKEQLETLKGNTTIARRQLAAVDAPPEADADMKRITHLLQSLHVAVDEVTVEQWVPALWPMGLELVVVVALMIAFSTTPANTPRVSRASRRSEPALSQPSIPRRQAPVEDRTPVADRNTGMPQAEVTALVEKWLCEVGIENCADMGVAACLKLFQEWAKAERPVSFVTFGRALDALGVEKRKLSGRVLIVGRRARS